MDLASSWTVRLILLRTWSFFTLPCDLDKFAQRCMYKKYAMICVPPCMLTIEKTKKIRAYIKYKGNQQLWKMEQLIIVPITTRATLFVECLEVCRDQNLEDSTRIWFAKCPSQQNTTVDNRPLFREPNARERMICRVPNSRQNKVLDKASSVADDS